MKEQTDRQHLVSGRQTGRLADEGLQDFHSVLCLLLQNLPLPHQALAAEREAET